MLGTLISAGGPILYILIACSVVSLAISLERVWFWVFEKKFIPIRKLRRHIYSVLEGNTTDFIGETKGFLSQVHLRAGDGNKKLARLLLIESERAYARSVRYLSGLDTVVSIAPLLGILGTVVGIMKSFHGLDLQHVSSPGEVGHGLAEAMITTAAGLSVAVPTLVLYNLFHSMANRHAMALYELSVALKEDTGNIKEDL